MPIPINQYLNSSFPERITITNLQEDNSGNINILYYNEVIGNYNLDKIDQNGNLIITKYYGDYDNYYSPRFIKVTKDFIYMGIDDPNFDLYVLKIGKTLLDTIFNVDVNIGYWGIYDLFDANDSSFYLAFDMGGPLGGFKTYAANGSLACFDSLSNLNTGYRLCSIANSCYIAKIQLSVSDACAFYACSRQFDSNTFNLVASTIGFSASYPNDNYSNNDVIYFASDNASGTFGIVGVINDAIKDYSGNLYFDVNNNCNYDSGEIGISNQLIKISPQNNLIFTNDSGYFKNYLDSGSYSLTAEPLNSTSIFCPVSIPLNITDTTLMYSNNNIAVQDLPGNLQDLAITINQYSAIPGYFSFINLNVKNFGPLPASGIIKLSIDVNLFNLANTSITPDSISGSDYFWHLNNVDFLNQQGISIEFGVNISATLGTLFTTRAEIININTEINLSNNIDIYTSTIVGSFDPNIKSVYPKGLGTAGVISPLDTILKYKIQFQNTGTYQAFKIVVIDTIDPSLDISTFKLLSTSHPCKMSFAGNNVLQFTFEDINLPDSSTSEVLSHGFINYSIKTKSGLALLTQIKNKAAIYFDFNEPVITNETINTIDVLGIKENENKLFLSVYPNPAKDQIKIFTNIPEKNITITIYDLQGRIVKTDVFSLNAGIANVSLENIQTGYYLLKAGNDKFYGTKSFVKE